MSLILSDLSVLAYANNFTQWHYKTTDESVLTMGYFNKSSNMMNVNDIIIANVNIEDRPDTAFYSVTDITSGVVTITKIK
jgi:hypothetical protein